MAQIGVITEIGDMGLGFEPLNEADQKSYNENLKKEEEKENQNKEENN